MDVNKMYSQYVNIDIGDLSSNQKDSMYELLKDAKPEEVRTLEEHKRYIEILQKLRMASMKDMERMGAKFLETLKSLLAVGEDGVYSNSQRFIYELIQNVDDCDYEKVEDCKLDIQFKYHTIPGEIVLTYNERGFKPENAFAITGIAEKSKNITPDKVEIGEKGIGFKSVFGIAEKVHIESGYFSFELYRDNFTVPVPCYDDFTPVKGTRLTLEMPADTVKKVYRGMVEQYMKGDAALNQNPILFLNKLTHLKMYFDGFRYIEFDVQRKEPEMIGGIAFENDVIVSVDMKDHNNGLGKEYSSIIECKRYTKPILYGENECKARYGNDAPFTERRHNLIALFPTTMDNLKDYKGLLYSFLPTQIHMTAPIVLHVPFKLDGSREFVDPQGGNKWFTFTMNNLEKFLKTIYVHLATQVKQDVITYIPNRHNFFFKKTNEKIQCILKNELRGDAICLEKVFYTSDGSYESVNNIVSFADTENLENPVEVFALLGESSKLFIPNYSVNMEWYGAKVISNVPALLFKKGIQDETNFYEIAKILDVIGKDLKYVNLIDECCPLELTRNQLLVINTHRTIYTAFNNYGEQSLKSKWLPRITFANDVPVMDGAFGDSVRELTMSADLDAVFEKYLKIIDFKFFVLKGIKLEFAITGKDGIVIAEGAPMGSFGSLTAKYDPRRVFVAALQIRQASDKLNEADESMSDAEYLKLLRSVRASLKSAFGNRMYNSYIQIINQAGMDKNRFLNELLQNADDCSYQAGVVPTFDLKINNNQIVVTYNELGFSKQNVRAITAIGESTKKLLLDGKDHSIGEKGVGFKSVFGVAESVEIHSNGFDFKLTDKMPTVPDKCDAIDNDATDGTTLIFNMKSDIRQALKEDRILRLCLCLRNLKKITIQGIRVTISDTENERVISIGDNIYHFEKFTYEFEITDDEAIEERSVNQRVVSTQQNIYCYIPKDYKTEKYSLYVGLPTTVDCNVPLIMDAPFELTTSRDNVIECRWNELVREAVYEAFFELMFVKKEELRIDILKFVKFTSQNGTISYGTFSQQYLNRFDWISNLKTSKLLPVLNVKHFVSAEAARCLIVPEVIAYVSKSMDVANKYDGVIIDSYKKTQYVPLLESIGCSKSDVREDLNCISIATPSMINDEKFRDGLYTYLQTPGIQAKIIAQRLYDQVKELPIFPIRTRAGVEYVSYSRNIYTHPSKVSDSDFLILETKVLKYEQAQSILGNTARINELSQEVYEARYQNNLLSYIKSNKTKKEKAFYILNEFTNNFNNFKRCQLTLKGMISEIPIEFVSGNYQTGNKFINNKGLILDGEAIQEMIVSDSFSELARYLGCSDILEIHYDDIDIELESITDVDIEDFQNEFAYGMEILEGFIRDGIISDKQIEKYNLEYLVDISDDDDDYEDFPGRAVNNLQKLRKHVRDQFRTNPNPYVEKQQTVHVPKNPVNKVTYTTAMYASENNSQKCFCQMCQKIVPKTHIERNDVQKNPEYGWDQMYLNLCLNCSKDYILLRNNNSVWDKFTKNILASDVEDEETVYVSIGNKELAFTAIHLAEIQTILKLEQDEK
jgi:hypothetical protein